MQGIKTRFKCGIFSAISLLETNKMEVDSNNRASFQNASEVIVSASMNWFAYLTDWAFIVSLLYIIYSFIMMTSLLPAEAKAPEE